MDPDRPVRLRNPTSRKRLSFDQGQNPSPKKMKKIYNETYREKQKTDPRTFASFKAAEAKRMRLYRSSRNEEQKAAEREKDKLRKRALRARKRESASRCPDAITPSMRPVTRLDEKRLEDRRSRNRESQRKRRACMSSQKKRRERERNRIYYNMKKAEVKTTAVETHEPHFMSTTARTSAVSRLKKKIGSGPRFFLSLRGLLKSIQKKKPKELKEVGISYVSPSKSMAKGSGEVCASLVDNVRKKRCKYSLKTKRQIVSTVSKVLDKYEGQKFLKESRLKRSRVDIPYTRQQSRTDELIENFYHDKAVHLPGKKDVSKKTLKTKMILDKSVNNLFKEFVCEHGSLVAKATFFRKRPSDVLSFLKTPFRQCLCDICMNPMLKLKAVNDFSNMHFESVDDLVKFIVCDGKKMECLKGKCLECGLSNFDSMIDEVRMKMNGQQIEWWRWQKCETKKGSRVDMVKKCGNVKEWGNELKNDCKNLPMHFFVQSWQSSQFRYICRNLPERHAVLVMDFAENYLCRQQDQPQSAFFGYSQVTVHPCVLYTLCDCGQRKTDNFVFFSDVLDHSANMVHHIMLTVFSLLQDRGTLSKLIIFSDGCASQYKSKLPFHHLQSLCTPFEVERCYFGARHGKNPCDALGGLVKQSASRSVQARQNVIKNAQDFLHFAEQALTIRKPETSTCLHVERSFFLIEEDDIVKMSSVGLKTISGTRAIHSLRPVSGALYARNLSCFCSSCRSGNYMTCDNKNIVDDWKIVSGSVSEIAPTVSSFTVDPVENRQAFFHNISLQLGSCLNYSELERKVNMIQLESLPSLPTSVPHSICDCSEKAIDYVALSLVPKSLEHLFPVLIDGDGNCMPRAISVLLFGSQEHHEEIRCRIVLELVRHCSDYLSLSDHELNFISQLSDNHCDDTIKTFQDEVLNTCKLSNYMGMWQLMAASNALSVSILSVYPSKGPKCNSSFFNKVLRPRKSFINTTFTVMWSSCRDDMPDSYWVANHIVPLLALTVPTEVSVEVL